MYVIYNANAWFEEDTSESLKCSGASTKITLIVVIVMSLSSSHLHPPAHQ